MRRWQLFAAAGLVAAATALAVVGQPTPAHKLAWRQAELAATLARRDVHIDPLELLGLMHNRQIRLVVLDVRDEADFNLFHLRDARRVGLDELDAPWLRHLPMEAIKVIVADGEARAEQAWQHLAAQNVRGLYLLAGGIDGWLDAWERGFRDPPASAPAATAPASQRPLRFAAALGDRHPAAKPDLPRTPPRTFVAKVKFLRPLAKTGAGCGG